MKINHTNSQRAATNTGRAFGVAVPLIFDLSATKAESQRCVQRI